jgi:hypothetical protein
MGEKESQVRGKVFRGSIENGRTAEDGKSAMNAMLQVDVLKGSARRAPFTIPTKLINLAGETFLPATNYRGGSATHY